MSLRRLHRHRDFLTAAQLAPVRHEIADKIERYGRDLLLRAYVMAKPRDKYDRMLDSALRRELGI